MRHLRQGIALAVVGAGLAAVPFTQALAQPNSGPSLVQQMTNQASGSVKVSKESANGAIGFIRTKGDLLPGRDADTTGEARSKADAYIAKYAESFGARPSELTRTAAEKNTHGWTVKYHQTYRGVPVFGAEVRANLDDAGRLRAVNGYAAPDLTLSTDTRFDEAAAGKRAVGVVRMKPPTSESGKAGSTAGLKAKRTDKVVYRLGSTRGVSGKAIMAYAVEVTNEKNIRDTVILDANTLKPVNRWSNVHDALDRALFTFNGTGAQLVWEEGDAFPGSLDQDQQNLVQSTGESYNLFANMFGRDSFDGEGSTMMTLHNRPDSCPNASWNGAYTSYCAGVYADDVVSHEWGHAYTEYTSGLIYQWQSGALNESYSDVWGETLDLVNNREDEGEGDLTVKRPDGLCSQYTRGGIGVTLDSPASIAGPCASAAPAGFGTQFTTEGVTADVVVAKDEANPAGPTETDGCSTFTNAADVSGKWAYVDRGTCAFTTKVNNAVAAGATGIVFGNRDETAISVSGNYEGIYGLMVGKADGDKIKSVTGPVSMTVKELPRDTADSYRWLIGEKSPAFGGAIRDMWNPTCYGDPGKVSDAEYYCTADDNGGVHGNSAVPNHAYALLVDGGTFNGVTSTGIGLDKAANIYWRTQTSYLTATSDFIDQADGLEASCADLVGQDIPKISLADGETPELADPITASDCEQVAKVNNAVELRLDPTAECKWTPMLDPNTPSTCGEGFTATQVWGEDFEDGLTGWDRDQDVAFEDGNGYPWLSTRSAPGGADGRTAFGRAPDAGNCSGEAGDISSVDSITSPDVTIPASGQSPRMSFDHYMATEAGFDGGNVKMSVNGGEFELIPTEAYAFNAPEAVLEPALDAEGNPYNTNPLADQPGFTGTNPGAPIGSWGTSIVDLSGAGVKAGDTVAFRFDVGRDGCGGVQGWYVDNVSVDICEKAPATVVSSSTKLNVKPKKVAKGKPFTLTAKVKAKATVTGKVTFTIDGKKVGTAKVKNGKAVLKVSKKKAKKLKLKVGKHKAKASYAGSATVKASADSAKFKVVKK